MKKWPAIREGFTEEENDSEESSLEEDSDNEIIISRKTLEKIVNTEYFSDSDEEQESINAQEWLDKEYPIEGVCQRKDDEGDNNEDYDEERSQITKLDISRKELTGSCKLTGFSNLTALNLSDNQITNLDLNDCVSLTWLFCSNNQFTNLDFLTSLNPNQLTGLSIKHNNFCRGDLTIFSPLINLEQLSISDKSWTGSLRPLQSLNMLMVLDISYTKIDSGLEYLPESLEIFDCDETKLEKEIKKYGGTFRDWRENYYLPKKSLEEANQKLPALENQVRELTNLIKNQKDRIVQAYLCFFEKDAKELLRELINAHLELTKAKKQKQPSFKLRKEKERICNKLEEKLNEEQMEQVETILTECEDLVSSELELEAKINNEKLITGLPNQAVIINGITINITSGHAFVGHTKIGANVNLSQTNYTTNNTEINNSSIRAGNESCLIIGNRNSITSQTELQANTQVSPKFSA